MARCWLMLSLNLYNEGTAVNADSEAVDAFASPSDYHGREQHSNAQEAARVPCSATQFRYRTAGDHQASDSDNTD